MDITGAVLSALFGGFFGATFALLTTLWFQSRTDRQTTTQKFIDEFHSTEFLKHRIGVSNLRRRVMNGEVPIDQLAAGYWYPGYQVMGNEYQGDYYKGEQIGDFNEHQHLTGYFGYLIRLAHAYKKGRVDKSELSDVIRTHYFWHGDLITLLAQTVESQVAEYSGLEIPIWVKATHTVNEMIGYQVNQLMNQLKNPAVKPKQ